MSFSGGKGKLILSCFPGIDLLGRAFAEEMPEVCIVRGPDLIFGGDHKRFHVPAGVFWGLIAGDPCQAHGKLKHMIIATHGLKALAEDMTHEVERIINEAQPEWFIRENSPFAYDLIAEGYIIKRVSLDNRWLGERQQRKRCFWFGTRNGRKLSIEVAALEAFDREQAVTSSGQRVSIRMGGNGKIKSTWQEGQRRRRSEDSLELQGFPRDLLADAPFTEQGKREVIANGVPRAMGRAIARAVRRAMEAQ